MYCRICYGVHRKSNNIFSQQLCEFILLLFNISYSTDILQQGHCTQISSEKLMPLLHHQFLPLQCLPCCFLLLEVVFVTQHAPAIHQPCNHHQDCTPKSVILSPPPSLKSVEEEQFLKTLCTVKPYSQDAQDLIDDILSGESELFKLPTKSQVPLLYKALQNIWCQSVCEFFP